MKNLKIVASVLTVLMSVQAIAGCNASTAEEQSAASTEDARPSLSINGDHVPYPAVSAEQYRDVQQQLTVRDDSHFVMADGSEIVIESSEVNGQFVTAAGYVKNGSTRTSFRVENMDKAAFASDRALGQVSPKIAGWVVAVIAVAVVVTLGVGGLCLSAQNQANSDCTRLQALPQNAGNNCRVSSTIGVVGPNVGGGENGPVVSGGGGLTCSYQCQCAPSACAPGTATASGPLCEEATDP